MKTIDFKREAQEFSTEHGFRPVFIIEAAMRHAAGLVVDGINQDIKEARASLLKEQARSASNGDTKVITTP